MGGFSSRNKRRFVGGIVSKNPVMKAHFPLFDNDPIRGQNLGPLGIKIPISVYGLIPQVYAKIVVWRTRFKQSREGGLDLGPFSLTC